jgi:hypothetical protein
VATDEDVKDTAGGFDRPSEYSDLNEMEHCKRLPESGLVGLIEGSFAGRTFETETSQIRDLPLSSLRFASLALDDS